MTRFLEATHLPLPAKDFHPAMKWWASKTEKQQDALIKKHKLVTWADLIKLFKAGN